MAAFSATPGSGDRPPPDPRRLLVLWDVDHTLLSAGPVSRGAYADAFVHVTGRELVHLADMAGRTDLHITQETLRLHGIEPTDDAVRGIMDGLLPAFLRRHHELLRDARPLPGAAGAVRALATARHVVQSVLTGNLHATTHLKLAAVGLAGPDIDLAVGAYGDDHRDRARLVPLARSRAAAAYRTDFGGRRTVVIGDTVHDVSAALAGGASVVAVATGRADATVLAAAGAHAVLPDLADTAAVLAAIRTVSGAEA
ncbi:haloacid dehalogenase-like hydrolase [Yinghuangia aomiensis]|uniref:Haloacid dehalogenase-like hydrolase n=1 Tax=Yinghuangia aomiensis TaxID=676205 RepID=A0ABP9HAY6_9ACTN